MHHDSQSAMPTPRRSTQGLTLHRSFRPRIKRDQKRSTSSRGRLHIVFDESVQLSA
ncbi:hypothetical protein CY34DRAFT_799090 [Suillus luteus UH-Slu-Lm8-n1]|uniref:Uncharacterized protein n=1 Tax=Suillus luteus UH-Slu-Lm8-n1 TaxID=930992 RepID=A0A0D0BCT0_9AGAM|nr:hypothetical protein CY34DRAFT_799090 [Suillus luteus UH-Slu-Lm8-n1]